MSLYRLLPILAIGWWLTLSSLPKANAQWAVLQKITSSPPVELATFGWSVAVDGAVMVVGAPGESTTNGGAYAAGAAYVFEKQSDGTWQRTARLTASDAAGSSRFGNSVAISGTTVVVGGGGKAYVFERPSGGWVNATETAKLTFSDGGQGFGGSVAISGTTVVVGAWTDGTDVYLGGSAYVFERPSGGWVNATQTAKLTPSDPESYSEFGWSVAVSGTTVVVGAYGGGEAQSAADAEAGSAYVFERPSGGWTNATQTAKLTSSDGMGLDYFGHSVSVSGNTIVVGANRNDEGGTDVGAVYFFERPDGGWVNATQTAKLVPIAPVSQGNFGKSVSISGDNLVVGAPLGQGAYVFTKSPGGWSNATQATIPTMGNPLFGLSVSASGNTLVIGAHFDSEMANDAGAAFIVGACSPSLTIQPTLENVPVCAGQNLNSFFDAGACLFSDSNEFTVQLSSSTGSFANPVVLGTAISGSSSLYPIPTNLPAGAGYRIRVVSNNPALTSPPSAPFTINTQNLAAIASPTTPSQVCQGGELPVSTRGLCPFPEGNTFLVQLSNAFGSFANPTVLGEAQPGTTPLALPEGLPPGTGYRVRIVSSNPALTSPASASFQVKSPSLSVTPTVSSVPVCRGNAVSVSFTLPATGCPFPNGNEFTAQLSSATGSFNNPTNLGPVAPGEANSLTIPAGVSAGSGYRIRIVSSSPALTSSSSAPFRVNACVNRLSAAEPQLVIAPNPVVGGEIRVRVSGMDNPAFSLTTATGRSLNVGSKTDGAGEFVVTPRQTLTAGVYLLQASEGSQRLTQRVLVSE